MLRDSPRGFKAALGLGGLQGAREEEKDEREGRACSQSISASPAAAG